MGSHDDKHWEDRVLLGLENGEEPLEWVPLSRIDGLTEVGHRIAGLLLKGHHDDTLIAEPRRLEAVPDGEDLLDRAARQVVAWWGDPSPLAEHQQRWKRVLGLGPLLARATARDTVLTEVDDCVRQLFPARPAVVLERAAPAEWMVRSASRDVPGRTTILPDARRMGTPGVWDCTADPDAPHGWKDLARAIGCDRLIHLPLDENAILVLGLPRMDRLAIDEWPLLRSLAHTTGRALAGIEAPDAPRAMLTDSATGLPNRLHADVILDRLLGAARRGESLSVVLVSLSDPDRGVAPAGSALQEAASAMKDAVRQADLVARFDDHTFLLALPRCATPGAQKVTHRLRARLHHPFDAGTAEFGPDTRTEEALVEAARTSLERSRRVAVSGSQVGAG